MMKQEKKQNKKKRLKRMLCLFFLLVFVVAGYFVYRYYQNDKKQEERFDQLEEIEEERDNTPVPQKVPQEENPDWIGWLKIKGTSISYPVMQRKGESEYYLHRDFDGNYSFYGTPFLDARCTPDSDNGILYGHNINGGKMFGTLHAYVKETYYKEHSEVTLRLGEEKRTYQIVSVIQTTISSPIYSFTDVGNWDEYQEYVSRILSTSLYQTKMGKRIEQEMKEDTKEDFFRLYQFLTLSTCRSWVGRDARLLVISVRKRKEQ